MLKRVTLLRRRHDLSQAAFSAHWQTDHAAIAVGLPGLVCYRQNHVTQTVAVPDDGPSYAVDGVVELWFTGAGDARAGLVSNVADRLVEDEPRFLDGLTGGTMTAPPPDVLSPAAVWVLACWRGPADVPAVRGWLAETEPQPVLHLLDESEPLLLRDALDRETEMPQVLLRAPAADTTAAQAAAGHYLDRLPALAPTLRRMQVLTATVVPIVEPTRSRSPQPDEGEEPL